jgi:hypothetical protein
MSDEILSLCLAVGFVGSLMALENNRRLVENFSESGMDSGYPSYPQNKMFYASQQAQANANFAMKNGNFQSGNVQSNNVYAGPVGSVPQNQQNINLNTSGDQLLAYQMYQQAVNAATPTLDQLQSISGESQMQTGNDSPLKGGVASDYAPYNIIGSGPELYNSEFQAVNIGNERADGISACAQSAPTFVATSLLPKPSVPGQDSWDISAPQDILATQNFLSAIQQIGTDTVLSSNRNPSYDIRNNIPNPINVASPWNMTTITPDLEKKPLDCYIPQNGLYGCGPDGANTDGTYVGYDN